MTEDQRAIDVENADAVTPSTPVTPGETEAAAEAESGQADVPVVPTHGESTNEVSVSGQSEIEIETETEPNADAVTPSTPVTLGETEAAAEAESGQADVPVVPTHGESTNEVSVSSQSGIEIETEPKSGDATAAEPRPAKPKAPHKPHVASLYRAMRSARPVDGTVKGVIKGGYEISLGKARGFCPHSQIDLHRVDDPESHVGKTYPFRVTQIRRGGDDVVVSRRAILDELRKDEASAVRATLLEGAIMRGHVAAIADFGAFVDLGAGVRGLVHVSELAHSRVTRVQDAVKIGDEVQVKILKLAGKGGKISLSIRKATSDPWSDVEARFAVGQSYPGTVKRLTQFGAFVELAPGVEALAPASEFPPSDKPWREELDVGGSRDWLVLSVHSSERRISITLPVPDFDPASVAQLDVGQKLKGRVQRIEDFGIFVWLGPGRVGLMPLALSGVPRGTDPARRYPVGSEVEVEIRELSPDSRRIRLAKQGLGAHPQHRSPREQRAARARPEKPTRPAPPPREGTFGTSLADKLRAALSESRNS